MLLGGGKMLARFSIRALDNLCAIVFQRNLCAHLLRLALTPVDNFIQGS